MLKSHLENSVADFVNNLNNNPGKPIYELSPQQARNVLFGDESVIVAVLDEGIFVEHPDLKDNIWVNENEVYRSLDDNDGNGFKGDYYGYNFAKDSQRCEGKVCQFTRIGYL